MKVRPADGSGCHLDNGIARIDDFRIGYGIHPDIMCSMPSQCAHDASPLICQAVSRRLAGLASSPVSISILKRFIRSEEHTSELQSLMRISYAVFCLKKKIKYNNHIHVQRLMNYKQQSPIYTN